MTVQNGYKVRGDMLHHREGQAAAAACPFCYLKEVTMAIINLRRYYPHYPKDKFLEVPDEVVLIQDEDEAAAERVLENLTAAIAQLSPIQARRLHARYALKKKYREIAADEGVTGSCAAKSVTSAVTKLQKFFIKNGWMPKEA